MPPKRRPTRKRSVNVCSLDDETLNRLKADFARFDKDCSGTLSSDEIQLLIKESYLPSETQMDNVFSCLSVKEHGKIAFEEFLFNFYRVFRVAASNDFECVFNQFASELHAMARSEGGMRKNSQDIQFKEEVMDAARQEIGAEWIKMLKQQFHLFSSSGNSEALDRDDMAQLLKAAFTPSDEKIEKVMQFFVMAAEDKNISLDNFLKGMTLLFGDLTHLAASPIARMSPTVSPAMGAQAELPLSPSPIFNLWIPQEDEDSPASMSPISLAS